MINSFSQYLVEEESAVYFTFGRMNPPTVGHGKLLDKLSSSAGRNPYKVFLSQSQDSSKNPLSYSDKVKHVRKMFPKHARNVIINKNAKTVFEAVTDLYNQGFRKLFMVVGSDRVMEFEALLNKYNGKEARHGFYNFKDIKVISAGERDPDAEGVEGMSASKMRKFAADNDFTSFAQGLPASMSNKDAKKLFNDIRSGMGLKEEKTFKNHVALEPVSDLREQYVAGKVFNVGDEVILSGTDTIATIVIRGSNYVIVEYNGYKARRWLNSIELIEQKAPKEQAAYQDKPKGNEKCINCTMWRDPNKCTAVSGNISPNGWCTWYEGGAYGKRGKRIDEKTDRWYNNQPDWGTPESAKKARTMTPGQTEATKQDPDIADRPGTQPARYHSGLSTAIKVARDRQFKKQTKMADDDPKAYKLAPGDKTAKTKPSKYTTAIKRIMGEQTIDRTREMIAREKERAREQDQKEKEQLKIKHDRMLDQARRNATAQKSRGVTENLDEASLADKASKAGVSVDTLRKVYNRGVAAWKTGHRPGTTPQQWGHARVNAFIVKKKRGNLNHDKDLA